MTPDWNTEFRDRMTRFEAHRLSDGAGVSLSIKIRVVSGCFHREHSPHAYSRIDQWLKDHASESSDFSFEEHESGPELLLWLAIVAGSINLATGIVNLVAAIIKARSDGVNGGDRPSAPLELIVRRSFSNGEYREEKVLRVEHHERLGADEVESKLEEAIRKMADRPDTE
ncbi:MAG: hypothetical protein H6506_04240 [Calditrichaeota bacterium]|nr:hypothetical protein [Calditrichota bacterium]MCB9366030.1 hypothetical protein [Calditrichota bacterium]MCB9391844.1 hypothetical protein [Calditrichota bacterium]